MAKNPAAHAEPVAPVAPDAPASPHVAPASPHAAPSGDLQIPPPPWQRAPERPARRRRDPISRDAIVIAAIQLLDREGLAALSMRKLADELGTGAASLY